MTAMGVSFATLWTYVLRHDALRTDAISPARKRVLLVRFALGAPIYAAGIGLAFLSANISLLLYGALAVYYLFEPIPNAAEPGEKGERGLFERGTAQVRK